MVAMPDSSRKGHILVVEDDRDIRESLTEVLEDEGYSVAEAEDGVQALEYLKTAGKTTDLILLDLMMPNMNGFEFREAQLEDPRHATIPVAVLTADASVRYKAATLKADAYVRKPLKIDALVNLVGRVLRAQ